MWTAANPGWMAAIEKKIRRCPTVLTDEGWSQVEGLLPKRQMEIEPERRYSR